MATECIQEPTRGRTIVSFEKRKKEIKRERKVARETRYEKPGKQGPKERRHGRPVAVRSGGVFAQTFRAALNQWLSTAEETRYKHVQKWINSHRHATDAALPPPVSVCPCVDLLRTVRSIVLGSTQFYWVLPSFTGFYQVLPSFTGFQLVLLGFTRFYLVLLGFSQFYWVLPSFTGFYWVLPSFTGFQLVLLGFTQFYWVLPSFTGFYQVLLGFTQFYWV